MARRINIILIALIVLVGAPYYWLLVDNRPGPVQPKPVSIEQLRNLAGAMPGAAPAAVEFELAGIRLVPRNLFAAGAGLKRTPIQVIAYRLPVPAGQPIVIDSGLSTEDAKAMGIDKHDGAAQARIERSIARAGLVLFTHEHPDHMGAAVRLGEAGLANAWLNPGQLPAAAVAGSLAWPLGARARPRIEGSKPRAVAPGVVVIPAPSHTPGSQMVFVRLASGHELLFAGDIATLNRSWREGRARSRLVGDFIAPEERQAVYDWLATIRNLKQQAPNLFIVPGHELPIDSPNAEWRTVARKGWSV